jgi:glutathione S-transferase
LGIGGDVIPSPNEHRSTTRRRRSDVSATPKRLYDFPFSGNGYKIRLALAHLGFTVEYEIIDLLAGEASAPEFLAKNPMGQIPVLELDDGTFLRESNSILFWLTDGTPLMPTERPARARIVVIGVKSLVDSEVAFLLWRGRDVPSSTDTVPWRGLPRDEPGKGKTADFSPARGLPNIFRHPG